MHHPTSTRFLAKQSLRSIEKGTILGSPCYFFESDETDEPREECAGRFFATGAFAVASAAVDDFFVLDFLRTAFRASVSARAHSVIRWMS